MRSFIFYLSIIWFGVFFTSTVLAHGEEPPEFDEQDRNWEEDYWGYIRVDNDGAFVISSKCYSDERKNSSWKRTYNGGFRSCHGDYIRVDILEGGTYYFRRSRYKCGEKGLYIKIYGLTRNVSRKVECK